jgi:hypothetical protein
MVPYLRRQYVLLILSALQCAVVFNSPVAFAADESGGENFIDQFQQFNQSFRDDFFSQGAGRPVRPDYDYDKDVREYIEKKDKQLEKRRKEELIEEKAKQDKMDRLRASFDRDESMVDSDYATPMLDNGFETRVLSPDLFSPDRKKSPFSFAQLPEDDDGGKVENSKDWQKLQRSNRGLFPRAREVNDHSDEDSDDEKHGGDSRSPSQMRRDHDKLPGRVIEITGDWVPDKLDPLSNGGFTIAPDNGSPVPYKLNGHVDIQRGRPWNDND